MYKKDLIKTANELQERLENIETNVEDLLKEVKAAIRCCEELPSEPDEIDDDKSETNEG